MADRFERIDELIGLPVVGRYYLVPTIHWDWYRMVKDWPVIGVEHIDVEFFEFRWPHYHLDRRFMLSRDYRGGYSLNGEWVDYAAAAPIRRAADGPPFPPRVWRPMKCRQADMSFPERQRRVIEMQGSLAGRQCKRGTAGWICPHRGFALGSIAPDAAGVLRCPMHGLRIDAATGIVCAPSPKEAPSSPLQGEGNDAAVLPLPPAKGETEGGHGS